jgi:hypothetical protein
MHTMSRKLIGPLGSRRIALANCDRKPAVRLDRRQSASRRRIRFGQLEDCTTPSQVPGVDLDSLVPVIRAIAVEISPAAGIRESTDHGLGDMLAQEKNGEPLEPPKERASNRIEKDPTRAAFTTRRQVEALAMVKGTGTPWVLWTFFPVAYDTTAELFLDLSEARHIVRDV